MTSSEDTGMRSEARKEVWTRIYSLWGKVRDAENPIQTARILMEEGAKDVDIQSIRDIIRQGL